MCLSHLLKNRWFRINSLQILMTRMNLSEYAIALVTTIPEPGTVLLLAAAAGLGC